MKRGTETLWHTQARMRAAARLSQGQLREELAREALNTIPRLLGFEDRTPYSRFAGCFDREYWHAHSTDFPSGLRQHAVHCLALAWSLPRPNNPYYRSERLLEWIGHGLDYAARIQGSEGAWDEFYPNEKGFGATALVVQACLSTLRILGEHLPAVLVDRVMESMRRGARFLGRHEKRVGFLANHYSFAVFALHLASEMLDEREFGPELSAKMETLDDLYHREGWHTEYDGLDPGYQTATVSFLARIYRDTRDPALLQRVRDVLELLSYFVYPDGHFAGSIGARQTVHAYLHGFEVFSEVEPMAASMADRLERAAVAGVLLSPRMHDDRYVHYRVEDFLLAVRDFNETKSADEPLPFEREGDLDLDLPDAGIHVRKRPRYYLVTNFARGGVTKMFELPSGKRLYEDAGVMLTTSEGSTITSQWIGRERPRFSSRRIEFDGPLVEVRERSFRPLSFALFRAFLVTAARNPTISNELKAGVRRVMMLEAERTNVRQHRELVAGDEVVGIRVTLRLTGRDVHPTSALFGGDWHVRYVPQSRFFQPSELDASGTSLTGAEMESFARTGTVTLLIRVEPGQDPKMASRVSFEEFGMDEHYKDEIVDQFSRWRGGKVRYLWQRRVETVMPHLPERGRILDAGCGDLEAVERLKRERPSLDLVACDMSRLGGTGFVRADIRQLPYRDCSFAAVMMMAVIEHVPDQDQAIREAYRVLEPEGLLLLTTPNPLYGLPMAIAGRVGLKYREGYDNSVSLRTLVPMAREAGFEVCMTRGFLALPVRTPLERMEQRVGAGRLGKMLLMNQFLKARKPERSGERGQATCEKTGG